MFDNGQPGAAGTGGGRTPGRVLADRIVDRDARIRSESVDAYEIPQQVRDAVRLRQVASVFPYSAATSTGLDLDHTDPYRWDGTPGQTGPPNLGPLTRGEHRAKTHGLWTVSSPHPGVFLWRAPHGHWFLSTNHGTQHLGPLAGTGPPAFTTIHGT